MAQAQMQQAAQPATQKPASQPAAQPAMAGQANMPPKQSGWIKWFIIVVVALVVLGGIALWILLP